jgi:hypothetical protein
MLFVCLGVKQLLAMGEDMPTDPIYVYQFVLMVHFDPNANIDSETASLRLPDWSLYLAALSPVSRSHLLTTWVNMGRVLSVCCVPDRSRPGVTKIRQPNGYHIYFWFINEDFNVPESHGSQTRNQLCWRGPAAVHRRTRLSVILVTNM